MYKNVSYWWDFGDTPGTIIVESDHPKYPVVAMFSYTEGVPGCAIPAINKASEMIRDLEAGRLDPRKANEY